MDVIQRQPKLEVPAALSLSALLLYQLQGFPIFSTAFQASQLQLSADQWTSFCPPNSKVPLWIRHGVFIEVFPVRQLMAKVPELYSLSVAHTLFIREQIPQLLATGVLVDITQHRGDPHHIKLISPLWVVEKQSGGKRRLCFDCRVLNSFLQVKSFKLDSMQVVLSMVQAGDFFLTIDMETGYWQVLVHEESRSLLVCEFDKRLLQWQVLPFGLASAPFLYTKMLRPLVQHWRRQGIRVSVYFDDIISMAQSVALTAQHGRHIFQDLHKLGLRVNTSKFQIVPHPTVDYLGFRITSQPSVGVWITREKTAKLQARVRDIL